jgi:hypothetical protein
MGNPNYRHVHHWLRKTRGKASRRRCACGALAREWSYIGPFPAPLTSKEGWPYSTDLMAFEAKCKPCHSRADYARRKAERAALAELATAPSEPESS